MITNIFASNNSENITIPLMLLKKSGIGKHAVVKAKKGEISIVADTRLPVNENTVLSEKTLADWNKPEEDKAWMNLR